MKKILLSLIFANIIGVFALTAQSTSALGMNYQAVARDASGQIISNLPISLKVALVSKNGNQTVYYTETHQVQTDNSGLFKIIIGEGKDASGKLSDVPWSKDQVWLDIAADTKGGQNYALVSSAKLLSVPYAFHAGTASQLVDDATAIDLPIEKNQSIYWTTGGNTATRPSVHFLGTRDDQDLVVKTNNIIRAIETKNGQLQIKSGVSGSDDDINAYPLTVEGSKQGIWIQVNGNRSMSNNFLTFADVENTWGAVEGQTLIELKNSAEYKSQVALFDLRIVSLTAQLVGLGIEIGGLYGSGFGAAAAAGAVLNSAGFATELASLIIESDMWVEEKIIGVGVSYSSGAGDYAEWLKRKPGEKDMIFGEIVGVNGGIVSRKTDQADHYMVVSRHPIVLGKMPQKDQEHLFEKIAFMGQVSVKVAGPVSIGDYIIPSGNHDGIGLAIHPDSMKIGDYSKIVGVAWQAAKDQPINYVNVAVGINSNDLSKKVENLNAKVEQIMQFLEGKAPLHGNNHSISESVKPSTVAKKILSDEEFDRYIDQNAAVYKEIFAQTKSELLKRGYENTELISFLDDPIDVIKKLRRNPNYLTQWALVDRKIKSNR
jgi:hypothetical protein